MSNSEIIAKLTEIQEYTRIIEEASAALESLKDEVKAHMGDETLLIAGPYKVTYSSITTNRLDTTALKKDLPDVAARYTKVQTVRRFIIK